MRVFVFVCGVMRERRQGDMVAVSLSVNSNHTPCWQLPLTKGQRHKRCICSFTQCDTASYLLLPQHVAALCHVPQR